MEHPAHHRSVSEKAYTHRLQPGGRTQMNTPSQTRNRTVSAVLSSADEAAVQQLHCQPTAGSGFLQTAKEAAHAEVAQHLAPVDPSFAFGCVDWYLYPDAKPEHAPTR
jgi:hypothetical protein